MTLNWPWSNICTAHRVIIANTSGKLFVNPNRGIKDKERTENTVIQCLILNFDLDLQLTLVKHKHCTSSHYRWHSCKTVCKFHQEFKRYRADTKYSQTMFYLKLWPWPWPDLGQTYLCKVICKSHQGFKRYRADTKVWRTDRRTNRRMVRQTTELKTICLPISWGET